MVNTWLINPIFLSFLFNYIKNNKNSMKWKRKKKFRCLNNLSYYEKLRRNRCIFFSYWSIATLRTTTCHVLFFCSLFVLMNCSTWSLQVISERLVNDQRKEEDFEIGQKNCIEKKNRFIFFFDWFFRRIVRLRVQWSHIRNAFFHSSDLPYP